MISTRRSPNSFVGICVHDLTLRRHTLKLTGPNLGVPLRARTHSGRPVLARSRPGGRHSERCTRGRGIPDINLPPALDGFEGKRDSLTAADTQRH
jgi:hypothetical protein